ncbi:MAG: tyrosine-type recombinase/integrase [Anaerolineales bacterium]|nr:tyrosine-type recombinase/integrase [Anaerolineales bacterium]
MHAAEATIVEVTAAYIETKSDVLSPSTLRDYGLTQRRLLEYFGEERKFGAIKPEEIRAFIRTIPGGKKNKSNAHTALGALWTFAMQRGYARQHIPRQVEIAKPTRRTIIPFSAPEIDRMLDATRESLHPRRDAAIIKVLLDTGIRASELGNLEIGDMEGDFLRILGKGDKERTVPISALAMKSIVDYLSVSQARKRTAPLFTTDAGNPLDRHSLRLMIYRIGNRSGVKAHPHKFRHTFAINYLLNGGDAYTLQQILGHSSMDMVKRYLHIANADLKRVHQRASPLTNLYRK